jgi:hypothetical protein
MIKNLVIKTIPIGLQRYPTFGDYKQLSKDAWQISISNSGDWRMNMLCALHEFVELALTQNRGIPEPVIANFDKTHPDSDEPGELTSAPYHKEHVFAETMERMFAFEMGINWQIYCCALDDLWETTKEKKCTNGNPRPAKGGNTNRSRKNTVIRPNKARGRNRTDGGTTTVR